MGHETGTEKIEKSKDNSAVLESTEPRLPFEATSPLAGYGNELSQRIYFVERVLGDSPVAAVD